MASALAIAVASRSPFSYNVPQLDDSARCDLFRPRRCCSGATSSPSLFHGVLMVSFRRAGVAAGGASRISCEKVQSSGFGEGPERQSISPCPRIRVRDPYRRLGLTREASTEEIQDARNFLAEQYRGHEASFESIEEAFDRIIAEKFRERKKSKINLKAELKKKVADSPPWVQALAGMVEMPTSATLLQRAILFVLIAAWSIMNPAEGGPAFQVAVALGLSVYLINDRLKSVGRAFTLGFGALVVGWVAGSFAGPLALAHILGPGLLSLELFTALVSYFFLWVATTFLK
eukprot:TRINITY_DN1222_c0_g1_i1.p1 TRINITY_DN1222_c0_g1~~TRINITY_DN1222_c0_g1_i1.p1  ORF type:complete len:316 (-),score=76.40 TRINITY_DN1222_c0_g1_i1:352-1218(-)